MLLSLLSLKIVYGTAAAVWFGKRINIQNLICLPLTYNLLIRTKAY